MKLLQTLLTLFLVALWPLAASHCSLEQVPGLKFLACGDEVAATHHQGNDCETDSCVSVESGFYKTEDGRQVVPEPTLVEPAFLVGILLASTQPIQVTSGIASDSIPLELLKAWQFSHRTAAAPRAPSHPS